MIELPNGALANFRTDGSILLMTFADCPECRTVKFFHVLRDQRLRCAACDANAVQPVEIEHAE